MAISLGLNNTGMAIKLLITNLLNLLKEKLQAPRVEIDECNEERLGILELLFKPLPLEEDEGI